MNKNKKRKEKEKNKNNKKEVFPLTAGGRVWCVCDVLAARGREWWCVGFAVVGWRRCGCVVLSGGVAVVVWWCGGGYVVLSGGVWRRCGGGEWPWMGRVF